ncbi:MAG: CDP-alcohol phosphatidyltransferase family protein [Flavobacteriales bacterium]|nr:CDP-alcohol phosphatidyltransferase family protein [Flavobacteriales bacterium]
MAHNTIIAPAQRLRIPFIPNFFICFVLTQPSTAGGLDHCPEIIPTSAPAMPRLPRIPDLLTTANLSCGVASILLASQGQLTLACLLVFAGAAFDVLDGLAARALGGGSELGKQLDSLADMVTFGVAPMFVIFNIPDSFFFGDCVGCGVRIDWFGLGAEPSALIDLGKGLVLAPIPICSAWRLAKFNVDKRQSTEFLGLPTPSNALFWVSIPLILGSTGIGFGPFVETIQLIFWRALRLHLLFPLIFWLPLVLGILMLSELPFPPSSSSTSSGRATRSSTCCWALESCWCCCMASSPFL